MQIIPLEVVGSWPIPNYINPQTHSLSISVVSPLFLSLATICVFIRLYGRLYVRKWFGLDDILILISWISAVGVSAAVSLGVRRYDWDKHMWDIRYENIAPSGKVLYAAIIIWSVASSCVRLSILCLYYRLLQQCHSPYERRHVLVLHCVTFFTVSLLIVYLGTGIFPCLPINATWAFPAIEGAKCINLGALWEAVSVLNTMSEFVIALLPVVGAYTLGVASQQRWQVISLLSVGFFVVIAGCFRCFYVWKVVDTYDTSWWSVPQWICSEIEIDLALICACIAPLRPFVGRQIRRIRHFRRTVKSKHLLSNTSKGGNSQSTQVSTLMEPAEVGPLSPYPAHRLIDLEGISLDDGLGYTVTIAGPMSNHDGKGWRRKFRKSSHSTEIDPEKGPESLQPFRLEIETTKTFSVDQSERGMRRFSENPSSSGQMSPEAMTVEIDEASRNLSAWGYLTPSNEVVKGFHESGSEEAITALPDFRNHSAEYPLPVVLKEMR